MAQDHARAMCLGRQTRQGQLLHGAVPSTAGRRGPQKAICAVAASILTAIYHMLKSGAPHRDLGVDYFDRRTPEAKTKRLVAQLAKLGFAAQLQPLVDAA